jgi:hypothetical protein
VGGFRDGDNTMGMIQHLSQFNLLCFIHVS